MTTLKAFEIQTPHLTVLKLGTHLQGDCVHLHAKWHPFIPTRLEVIQVQPLHSAILPSAKEIACSRFTTSIVNISASTGPSDPSFGDVTRVVFVHVQFKFHAIRTTRSLVVDRGFDPCQYSKTEYKVSCFDCNISASRAARELRFGEDIPV